MSLKVVISPMKEQGIKVTGINRDNKFKKIQELLSPLPVNIVERDEHLATIK